MLLAVLYQSRSRRIGAKITGNPHAPLNSMTSWSLLYASLLRCGLSLWGEDARAREGPSQMTVSSDEQENHVGALAAMTLQSHSMLDSLFAWHSQWEQMQRTSRIRGWHVAWSVGTAHSQNPQTPVVESFRFLQFCGHVPQIWYQEFIMRLVFFDLKDSFHAQYQLFWRRRCHFQGWVSKPMFCVI